MGAQRAAWQVAFRAEAAARDGMHYAQSLLDLVKAFEMLPHNRIAEAAMRHGYNLWLLRLSLAAYRLPRSLGIDGAYSRSVIAVLGITAGSGFATTELRLLLLDVVQSTSRAWPLVTITLYVDDATLEAVHTSAEAVKCTIAGATDHMVEHLQAGLELEVSAKKSVTVACSRGLAAGIAAISRTRKLTAVLSAKLLGTTSGGGRRRAVKGLAVRKIAFAKRIPRIHTLRRFGIRADRVTRAMGPPMLTYGVQVCGMSDSHLQQVRGLVAKAAAPQSGGKAVDLVLYSCDTSTGTLDPAFEVHVQPLLSWALAHWQRWQPLASLNLAVEHARERVIVDDSTVWAKVNGPAAAVVASAHRLGWTFLDGSTLRCDDKVRLIFSWIRLLWLRMLPRELFGDGASGALLTHSLLSYPQFLIWWFRVPANHSRNTSSTSQMCWVVYSTPPRDPVAGFLSFGSHGIAPI